MLTDLSHLHQFSVVPKMEADSRFEKAQIAASAHPARGRGKFHLINDEVVKVDWDGLRQCASGQLAEFAERK